MGSRLAPMGTPAWCQFPLLIQGRRHESTGVPRQRRSTGVLPYYPPTTLSRPLASIARHSCRPDNGTGSYTPVPVRPVLPAFGIWDMSAICPGHVRRRSVGAGILKIRAVTPDCRIAQTIQSRRIASIGQSARLPDSSQCIENGRHGCLAFGRESPGNFAGRHRSAGAGQQLSDGADLVG